MPTFPQLSDAAIALHRILTNANIDFGIFGGYAINTIGGNRTSKDIDCAIGCGKPKIIEILANFPQFTNMNNSRDDVAMFMLGEVLIEFFPIEIDKLKDHIGEPLVRGTSVSGKTKILDPCTIFKGKLQATALRQPLKHTDAADLVYLEGRFNAYVKDRNAELSPTLVGMALKRHPHLQPAFQRLGVDLKSCEAAAQRYDPKHPPAQPKNSVQQALLYGLEDDDDDDEDEDEDEEE